MVVLSMLSLGVVIWILFCVFDVRRALQSDIGISAPIMAMIWAIATTALLAQGQGVTFFVLCSIMVAISMLAGGITLLTSPPSPDLMKIMGSRIASMGIYIFVSGIAWGLS